MLAQVSSQRKNHADCQSVVETLWRLQCEESSSDEDDAERTNRHLKNKLSSSEKKVREMTNQEKSSDAYQLERDPLMEAENEGK